MASHRALLLVSLILAVLASAAAFRLPFFTSPKADADLEVVENVLASVGKSLKHYATEAERKLRLNIVKANLQKIKDHNAKNPSWHMGVTNFIDMTDEELHKYLGVNPDMLRHQARTTTPLKVKAAINVNADTSSSSSSSSSSTSTSDESSSSSDLDIAVREVADAVLTEAEASAMLLTLPKRWDWREHGVVSPIKSQGGCGSCWSFSAAEAIESAHAIATGELVVLSEQNILDCTPNPMACGGHGGCTGATPEIAFAAMQNIGGITTEALYPYQSGNGTDNLPCRFSYDDTPIAAEVSGYVKLPPNDYARVMHAVATIGPLSVNVDATKFFLYRGGIFDACENTSTSDIDHAVVLVGYGTDDVTGLDYWLIRNSWSTAWGEGGYMRLKRTRDLHCYDDPTPDDGAQCEAIPGPTKPLRVCGDCGVLFDVSYPLVLKPTPPDVIRSGHGGHRGHASEEVTVTEAVAEAVGTLVDMALEAFDD